MKISAVICEYNPIHKGHKYQIDMLRDAGSDIIISVMSGSVTQRGECAAYNKYRRAKAALLSGSDLVVELPAPFCAMPAEYFARAGVIAASALGAKYLSFGSECGDINALEAHAGEKYRAKAGYGAAYAEFKDTDFKSNDILGIEYIRQIKKYDLLITPMTHKRIGDSFLSSAPESSFASASAIRALLDGNKTEEARKYIPKEALPAFDGAIFTEKRLRDERFYAALRSALLFGEQSEAFGMSGGLYGRMKGAAEKATELSEFYSLSATKVYTNARIRRSALFFVCGIPDKVKHELPEYISLLGMNKSGREYLASIKPTLPVLTTFREKSRFASFEYERRLDTLFEIVNGRERNIPIYLGKPIIL